MGPLDTEQPQGWVTGVPCSGSSGRNEVPLCDFLRQSRPPLFFLKYVISPRHDWPCLMLAGRNNKTAVPKGAIDRPSFLYGNRGGPGNCNSSTNLKSRYLTWGSL